MEGVIGTIRKALNVSDRFYARLSGTCCGPSSAHRIHPPLQRMRSPCHGNAVYSLPAGIAATPSTRDTS